MPYLILTHPGGVSAGPFDAMIADLGARGWRQALGAYGLAVMTRGRAAQPVWPLMDERGVTGVVVGEVFDRSAIDDDAARLFDLEALGPIATEDPVSLAQCLADQAFGDYVGLVRQRRDGQPAVFADPLGGRPAFAWTRDGVSVIGDEPPVGLAAPVGVQIDWAELADLMADRRRMGGAPPLTGLTWIVPGTCRTGPGLSQVHVLWTPAIQARRRFTRADPQALRQAVDGTLRAFLLGRSQVLCEISGGLDSAIVATSLNAIGRPPDQAINFFRGQAEADERVYARAAAERAATTLRCIERPLLTLTEAGLMSGAGSFRPNFEILDTDYDDLTVEAITDTGADIVFTGHGGDVVFYQMSAADLAGDLLRGVPCEGSRLARLVEVALRTRRSVWSLMGQALGLRAAPVLTELMAMRPVLARAAPRGPWHPWMRDLGGIPPAKRTQISGLALTQGLFAQTRRGAQARLCHPLLSQPVVEACLAIPTPILSQGEGERSFARRAFADRLPASITERRSKGDISVFMGRTLAINSPMLRAFLLDGRLVAQGVIDKAGLEAMLSPEALIFRDAYGEIVTAAVLEAFVRYWEGAGASGLAATAPGPAGASADSAA